MRYLSVLALSLVTLIVGLSACSQAPDRPSSPPVNPPPGNIVVGDDACQSDADCVPAGCCHPAACVAQANAPDCSAVSCTRECRPGTIDCGGACLCVYGRCAARLNDM